MTFMMVLTHFDKKTNETMIFVVLRLSLFSAGLVYIWSSWWCKFIGHHNGGLEFPFFLYFFCVFFFVFLFSKNAVSLFFEVFTSPWIQKALFHFRRVLPFQSFIVQCSFMVTYLFAESLFLQLLSPAPLVDFSVVLISVIRCFFLIPALSYCYLFSSKTIKNLSESVYLIQSTHIRTMVGKASALAESALRGDWQDGVKIGGAAAFALVTVLHAEGEKNQQQVTGALDEAMKISKECQKDLALEAQVFATEASTRVTAPLAPGGLTDASQKPLVVVKTREETTSLQMEEANHQKRLSGVQEQEEPSVSAPAESTSIDGSALFDLLKEQRQEWKAQDVRTAELRETAGQGGVIGKGVGELAAAVGVKMPHFVSVAEANAQRSDALKLAADQAGQRLDKTLDIFSSGEKVDIASIFEKFLF